MWIIYKHTLLAECEHKGWSYIGLTHHVDNLNSRFHGGTNYAYNKLFYADIQQYGWTESFSHEILQDNIETQAEAFKAERYWIAYYHTYINDKDYAGGYNRTPGGPGANHNITIMKDADFTTATVILSSELDAYITLGWRTLTTQEYKYWQRHILGKNVIENAKSREYYKLHGKDNYNKNKESRAISAKKWIEKQKTLNADEYKRKHAESNKKWREKQKNKIIEKKSLQT